MAVPTVDLLLANSEGGVREATFLVDSGADVTLAPRALCEQIGLDWQSGEETILNGISPKPECAVAARVFQVDVILAEISIALTIPMCFADGNVSQLLGRAGFFDCLLIQFDQSRGMTKFELLEEETD